jgi:hypothetical protein
MDWRTDVELEVDERQRERSGMSAELPRPETREETT